MEIFYGSRGNAKMRILFYLHIVKMAAPVVTNAVTTPKRSMFSGMLTRSKAVSPANNKPMVPKKTFKNRLFGTAAQQANAVFLAAAKAGNVDKLKTYTDDPTAKGFISEDTQKNALIACASIPSSDCFTHIATAFPQSLDAQTAGKQNVLHVVLVSLNKVSTLNTIKKTKFLQDVMAIISLINQEKPDCVNMKDDIKDTPLDIVCASSAKDSNDILSYILARPNTPSQDTLDSALAKIFETNVKVKNTNGWNKLFPKGEVRYKKVSALLTAGAKPPQSAPNVYGPLMNYYTKIDSNINAKKANLARKATEAKSSAEAEAKAAAAEEKAAQNAATAALATAKAAQNALAAKRKAKALAVTKKTSIVSKAESNKTAAVAALGPKKKLFGLFGGKRTRKNRKH